MIKLAVVGAGGRMGRRIIALANDDKEFNVICGIEKRGHSASGKDVEGVKISSGTDNIFMCDVVIDFSLADAFPGTLKAALQYGKPLVLGTTGLGAKEQKELEGASKKIPIVYSPNFSIGVNILFEEAANLAGKLGKDYDIEIVEAHHNKKKDAPSGTAKRFAQLLADASGKNIPVHAVRLGDIVGDHTIIFCGNSERIELTHRAHSRDLFAKGALKAAKWVVSRPAGLYTMKEVLG
ncbi:MAG: 4-hydroxy-tetrahydrodipicolinate reductase [Candidatus Omnitrophica bacterium]|nr:4-hydroxy-tetrahydrodipicolinate reductase [Candidatus Omnitrophota bacterium]